MIRDFVGFGAVVLLVVMAIWLGGCVGTKTPSGLMALTNVAPCYSGRCDTNCPFRNNANYAGCSTSGTGPLCPNGGGCRGIVLDK